MSGNKNITYTEAGYNMLRKISWSLAFRTDDFMVDGVLIDWEPDWACAKRARAYTPPEHLIHIAINDFYWTVDIADYRNARQEIAEVLANDEHPQMKNYFFGDFDVDDMDDIII